MQRSALPLVRGVDGRVRRCRSPRAAQCRRHAWARSAGPLSVITACTAMPWARNQARGPVQEGQGLTLAVTGPHLGVGQPRVVVDGHVHVLPAGARAALDAVAGDALADVPAAPQLLGIEVQQLPGGGALVAHDGGGGGRAGGVSAPTAAAPLPTVEAGRPNNAPSVTGPAPLRVRAARISASAAASRRRGWCLGVDRRSCSPAQPAVTERRHQR